jgi:hypothetical protein
MCISKFLCTAPCSAASRMGVLHIADRTIERTALREHIKPLYHMAEAATPQDQKRRQWHGLPTITMIATILVVVRDSRRVTITNTPGLLLISHQMQA